MPRLLIDTITIESISKYILEETNVEFYSDNKKLRNEFEKLIPSVYELIKFYLLSKEDKSKSRQNLEPYINSIKLNYRELIKENYDFLISLHLNLLILISELENESEESRDFIFQEICSELGDSIIEISKEVNEQSQIIN